MIISFFYKRECILSISKLERHPIHITPDEMNSQTTNGTTFCAGLG